ncbi:DNA/RNA non-specific endonuclease [Winogradskyella maritima]|uniref:Endonuclease n=1 Tax=Winogradskyella maritima TaxID=1517766 RepID=A0ABV8AP36_9FLAO|nr:DNA/RNA non-specific endonuclease [Winogradskyella maritima]
MKRRNLLSLIAVIILIAVFSFEYLQEKETQDVIISEGQTEKENTNTYFLPTSTTNSVVHHKFYSLSYSEAHEQAEWVAYELKANQVVSTNHKRPYFQIDKSVKTEGAHWRNYKNSGYDRGHLCPAGDRKFSKEAHDETFLTSNISPQEHEFNSGIWNRLEQKVRYWAKRKDGVFVVTGGILSDELKTIGEEHVAIPEYFYKIIYDQSSKSPKMLGFLIPHENSNEALYKFVVPVDQIEELTGIDFFPQLNDKIENTLERQSSYKNWSF